MTCHFKVLLMVSFLTASSGCLSHSDPKQPEQHRVSDPTLASGVSLLVLGTVQDGGSPHIGCTRACCRDLFNHPDPTRRVVSLGLIDRNTHATWLFDATPDMTSQLRLLRDRAFAMQDIPSGIFLTHAHIGHYAGLMYLGKEAANTHEVPVFVLPRMKAFLEQNGPWSQLVSLRNIALKEIMPGQTIPLTDSLRVRAILVPHRDEFSETAGYVIEGPSKKVLFIPDIDKWNKWDHSIIDEIKSVDFAFVDGSFFDAGELNNRDMSEIPHPFVIESMELFRNLPLPEKNKIYFIHFNHTNPALRKNTKKAAQILGAGFHIAEFDTQFDL